MLRILVMLALLAPAQSLAQTPRPKPARKTATKAATPTQWPIETLSVEGNQNYTKDQILAVAGLKVGQLAGKSEFDAARDRLVATGGFEKVEYRFAPSKDSSGYAASFQVVEAVPIYPVQFEGLPAKGAEIDAWLKSKNPLWGPKIPATTEALTRYTKSIQEFLASRNKLEKVVAKVMPVGPDQFTIVFRSAAPLATIAQVKFEGNRFLSTTLLQNKISEVAYGFPYTETGFRMLLDNAIRPLYDARGLVRAAFPKISVARAENDVNGVAVTVTVDEGSEFKLGKVGIAGSYAAKAAQLLKVGAFKSGEVANFDELGQGVDRIKRLLRRSGYMRAETTIERNIHDQPKTVDVTIRINEGPQFTFGKLAIEGLDLDGAAAIKKLWALSEGKPFNGDYPDYFLNRVRTDGLFDNLHNTKAAVKVNEEAHSVDVTLEFH